jgi:hypothetical protein
MDPVGVNISHEIINTILVDGLLFFVLPYYIEVSFKLAVMKFMSLLRTLDDEYIYNKCVCKWGLCTLRYP